MFLQLILAVLVAVCSAGNGPFKFGYGFVATGPYYGHHGYGHGHGHGRVAKVNHHQDNHHYKFGVSLICLFIRFLWKKDKMVLISL